MSANCRPPRINRALCSTRIFSLSSKPPACVATAMKSPKAACAWKAATLFSKADTMERWSFPATARKACWLLPRRASMTALRCRPSAPVHAAVPADLLPAVLATVDRLLANRAVKTGVPAMGLAAIPTDPVADPEDKANLARRQSASLRKKSAWSVLGLIKAPNRLIPSADTAIMEKHNGRAGFHRFIGVSRGLLWA